MLRKERENAVRSVSFLGGLLSVIVTRDIWYAASSFLIVNIFAAQPNTLGTATRIVGAKLDMFIREFIKALRFLGLYKAQSTDRNNIGDLLKSRIASLTKSLKLDPSTKKKSSSNDFVVPADEREGVYMAEIVMEVEKIKDKVGNDRLNSKDFELGYDDTDFFDDVDIRGTSVKKSNDVPVEKKGGFASEIRIEGGDNSKEGDKILSRTDAEYLRLEREASYLNMDSIADKSKIITNELNSKLSANTSDTSYNPTTTTSLPFYKIPVGSLNPTGTVTPVTPIGTITPITNSSGKIPLGTLISSASRNTYEIPIPPKKTTVVPEKQAKLVGGVSQTVVNATIEIETAADASAARLKLWIQSQRAHEEGKRRVKMLSQLESNRAYDLAKNRKEVLIQMGKFVTEVSTERSEGSGSQIMDSNTSTVDSNLNITYVSTNGNTENRNKNVGNFCNINSPYGRKSYPRRATETSVGTIYDFVDVLTTPGKNTLKQRYLSLTKEFHPDSVRNSDPDLPKIVVNALMANLTGDICIYIHIYTYVCIYICLLIYIYISVYIYIYIHMYVYIHVYEWLYRHIFSYMSIFVYSYSFLFISIY
jgi:hypothetical protein